MRERFIELLRGTGRPGIEELITWLDGTDFFTAPASTQHHGSHEGGLLQHSLTVVEAFYDKVHDLVDAVEGGGE